ncbi:hypothetical protein EST38_g13733 [Candolleomyces aberdarensis]|uniref:Uncharacterized protein n=1 Tax=Candolleomyces aberdarensis TaxID=2316362 RepID=A0A4Q2D094_9AGAR|nr:hypothetical protein EST38_g13733 [Candolleomyces aberdarensis]
MSDAFNSPLTSLAASLLREYPEGATKDHENTGVLARVTNDHNTGVSSAGCDEHDCENTGHTSPTPIPAEHALDAETSNRASGLAQNIVENPGENIRTPTRAHSIPLMPPTWRIVNASATNSPNASDSAATISQNVSKTPKFRSLSEQDKPGSKVATPEVSEAELSALSLKLDNFSLHPPQPEPSASPSDLPTEIRKQIAQWRASYGTVPSPTADTGAAGVYATAPRYPPSFPFAALAESVTCSPMAEDSDGGSYPGSRGLSRDFDPTLNDGDIDIGSVGGDSGVGSGSRTSSQASHQMEASSEDEDFVGLDRRASPAASVEWEKSLVKDFNLGSDPRPSSAAGVELESSKDEDIDLGSDRASPAARVQLEECSLKDEDFDLGSDHRPSPAASIELESSLKDEDFDLGSDRASPAASVQFEESSLKDEDFDLGSDCQPSPAASVELESSLKDEDFDLGSDRQPSSAANVEFQESSLKDEDFDLGLDSRPSPAASAELESSLKDEDFDLGSSPRASSRASGRTSDMEDQESVVASSSESVDVVDFNDAQHL